LFINKKLLILSIIKPKHKSMNEMQMNPSYELINKDSLLNLSNELALLIKEKGLSSNIQGKQFVNVEGWGYAGAAIGLIPIITSVQNVSTETEIKYLAVCEVRNIATGQVVSIGHAICSNKERTKRSFDEYAICSMAQTRAEGKAYRLLLGWLMKAAGFEATPAEEMDFNKEVAPYIKKHKGENDLKIAIEFCETLDELKQLYNLNAPLPKELTEMFTAKKSTLC
jgi:hypothetical protein